MGAITCHHVTCDFYLKIWLKYFVNSRLHYPLMDFGEMEFWNNVKLTSFALTNLVWVLKRRFCSSPRGTIFYDDPTLCGTLNQTRNPRNGGYSSLLKSSMAYFRFKLHYCVSAHLSTTRENRCSPSNAVQFYRLHQTKWFKVIIIIHLVSMHSAKLMLLQRPHPSVIDTVIRVFMGSALVTVASLDVI